MVALMGIVEIRVGMETVVEGRVLPREGIQGARRLGMGVVVVEVAGVMAVAKWFIDIDAV
jgi:hypothetical protein